MLKFICTHRVCTDQIYSLSHKPVNFPVQHHPLVNRPSMHTCKWNGAQAPWGESKIKCDENIATHQFTRGQDILTEEILQVSKALHGQRIYFLPTGGGLMG